MILSYNPHLKSLSRTLRQNMTGTELKLWHVLKQDQMGVRFYRQKPLGKYIVDFYCPKASLVIEIDGGQHWSEDQKAEDIVRDGILREMGLQILRFANNEVRENIDGVRMVIADLLDKKIPLNPPFPKGENTSPRIKERQE